MKPRLYRSSRRAFAFTHPLIPPSTSPREALLACPPFPLWNLPSFTVDSTFSSSCSRFDPLLSRQGGALVHLDSLPLVIWYSGLTALSLLLLAKAAPAYLPTAFSLAQRPLFSFQKAQYVQVFSLKPAPFCTLFAGLGSTNKPITSFLFFYLTPVLSSSLCSLLHLSSYLKLCGRSGRNCLLSPPVLSGYDGSPDTRFSRGTTRLMCWLDGEHYLRPLQSLVVSLLLPLVSTPLFSDWRRTVSSKFFDTQVSLISTEELVLPPHARCVLFRLSCKEHSLLFSSYLFKIGRIQNLSCSACGHSCQDISHLILHCPATDSLCRSFFGDSLSLYNLWSRPWGVSRLLRLHGFPPCPHPSEGVG